MAQRVKSITAEIGIDSKNFTSGANQIQNATAGIVKSIGGIAATAGIVTGVVKGMKAAFEFSEAGAQIQYTQDKFDALAQSIDTTSNLLMTDLRNATGGMVSDAKLMANASGFMSLGLVKTREEAVRLTTVAGQLNMDMNALTLTLTNQTTARFDTLGVAVDGFQQKVDDLTAAGMDADAAFSEAFLRQAEDQVKKVGSAADSAIAPFEQVKVALENMGDAAKLAAAEGFAPLIQSVADFLGLTNDAQRATQTVASAVDMGIITQQEADIAALATSYQEWIEFAGLLEPKIAALEKAEKSYTSAMEAEQREWKDRESTTDLLADSRMEKEQEITDALIAEIEKRNQALTKYNENKLDQIATFSSIERNYAEQSASIANDLASVQAELAEKRAAGYAEWGGTIQGLLAKEDELKSKAQEIEDAHQQATNSIILGYIEQKMAADGVLTDDETEWLLAKGVEWGIYADNAVQAYRDAQNAADEAMKHFQDKTITLTVNYATSGNAGLAANTMPTGYTEYQQHANGTQGVMTVPPGFPNDSYMIGLSTGEQYSVNSQAQQATAAPSQALEIDYDRMADAFAQAMDRRG